MITVIRWLQRMMREPVCRSDLCGAWMDAVTRHGRATLIVEDARRQPVSYGQLLKETLALGRLLSRQTTADETVGVVLPNLSTSLAAILGLSAHGRIPAMLNYRAGPEALRSACTVACIRTIITSRQFLERIKFSLPWKCSQACAWCIWKICVSSLPGLTSCG